MSDTPLSAQLEASKHLELAAFHLYEASRVDGIQLPSWDSEDVKDMRTEFRYLARGAHKRGNRLARLAVIERIAACLAVISGDHWPSCDNQIHRGLSEERVRVIAAKRRQWYRHQAILVCAEVAKFYEIDQDIPATLALTIERARTQQVSDKKIVADYTGRIGKGEVVAIGAVRE